MKRIVSFAGFLLFCISAAGQVNQDNLMKARALLKRGMIDEAVNVLSPAPGPLNDSRLYLERAEAYIMKGDYSAAISDCNEANRLDANSGEYALARIYSLKGDARTALYHLELNLGSSFRRAEKEVMLDRSFSKIENSQDWKIFWRKERYTRLEKLVSEIEFYASSGRSVDAVASLNELKDGYSNTTEASYAEALVAVASGKPSEALKYIASAAEQEPGEKILRLLAKAQESNLNYAGASVTYTRLLDMGIPDAGLLRSRAECYRKTGEYNLALADITRYLEFYPDDKAALIFAGKTEAVSGDNLKALEYFNKNLKLHPDDADCYAERGNSYLNSRSWEWAIKDYTMSLDLKPGNADAWLNKGVALMNSGKMQDACHDFRRALSLGNKRAAEYISKNCIK